jgi:hypothetical protein
MLKLSRRGPFDLAKVRNGFGFANPVAEILDCAKGRSLAKASRNPESPFLISILRLSERPAYN